MKKRKVRPGLRNIFGFAHPLVFLGFVLLLFLAVVINNALASRDDIKATIQPKSQSQIHPTRIVTNNQDYHQDVLIEEWETYVDTTAEFSFKYPDDWRITEVRNGQSVRLLNDTSPYYRGIEFIVDQNPLLLSTDAFSEENLEKIYGTELSSKLHFEKFQTTDLSGTKATGFPEGISVTYFISNNKNMLRVSLIEGGEIGGGDPSNFPKTKEDEQLLLQIINTIEFNSSHP